MTRTEIDADYVALQTGLTNYFREGGRVAIVKAPPGSGKTYTLIKVLSALAADGLRIAVATQTNNQAEDICIRWAKDHPEIQVHRFASAGVAPPNEFPASVRWITDKNMLPTGPGVTVATTAKWAVTDLPSSYDLLAIDEAWQMSWADLMQCALVSEKFLMIGDPGQIPPVVTVDVRRWETSPRAPHEPAPDVVLRDSRLERDRFVGSLPACRRLPSESVAFIKPFYDFDFEAYNPAGQVGLEVCSRWGEILGSGHPLALTLPTPDYGPPIEVDYEVAEAASVIVRELLENGSVVRSGNRRRELRAHDIGITSSHRIMNSALSAALGSNSNQIRVDTPERWQGLERPVMIAVHPLSSVADPSAFDLETGRLCVMASRHQTAFILVARDHVGETLRNFVPSAQQAPGRSDKVGRGHDAHLQFWTKLETEGSVQPLI